jgi:hypothetical protein
MTGVSPLEELRAEFAKPLEDPRLYKRLPAAGGKLVAVYQVVDNDTAEKAVDGKSKLAQDADLLTNALVEIRVHAPGHENADERETVEFGAWAGEDYGGPLKFDERLAKAIGIEPGSTHDICLRLFEGNQIALGAQAMHLGAWMTNTREEQLQDFTKGS